jgi:hypothetical protein
MATKIDGASSSRFRGWLQFTIGAGQIRTLFKTIIPSNYIYFNSVFTEEDR